VATPGRLEDLIEQGTVNLGNVAIAVVDEADRMADMGFLPAVRRILDRTPARRQTLLFSATLDGEIAVLSRDYQRDPVRHEAGTIEPRTVDARHHFWLVQAHERVQHTADLVERAGRSIVFTRTRRGADRLAKQLNGLGRGVVAMHGGRTQGQRNRALHAFASGRAEALIATDVAARGIHIDAVASVIHFDPPADHKDYLHRSGRTARAGAAGTVISLVIGNQQHTVRRMQRALDMDAPIEMPQIGSLDGGGHNLGMSPRQGPGRTTAPRREARSSRHPRRPATDRRSIYVANLPWGATHADVHSLFETYGAVHQTTIITDRRTGRSRGFGFVDMPGHAADKAIEALHGSKLGGRDLTVRPARPRR
jgi:superfamily II DNA/RNA helicase